MNNAPSERSKTEIGKKGEEMAAKYLAEKGYEILQFNYRYGRAEIDLVTRKGIFLVFVEVKYRTSSYFGFPEEFVDKAKMNRIKLAAENYIFEKNWQADIRFDIISIVDNGKKVVIEHFEDCL